MGDNATQERLAQAEKERQELSAYVERAVGSMLQALEGMADRRLGSSCDPEGNDDSLSALCLAINRTISDFDDVVRRSDGQRRLLRRTLEVVPDPVFTVDSDFQISLFNGPAEQLTGMSGQSVIGKPCAEVFHSPLCEHDCPLKASMEKGEVVRREMRVQGDDGVAREIIATASAMLGDDGSFTGGVGVLHDVTVIRQRERELRLLRDEFKESNVQLSSGLAEFVRLLNTVRAGDMSTRVDAAVLSSDHELVSALGQQLNETVIEFQELLTTVNQQSLAIQELSTPIIPIMDRILVMPLVGTVDTYRARDIMRSMLAGITTYRALVVILDITGVPLVDTSVASHLHKTYQAARLKGAHVIVTGISDAVAETITDLGIDWSGTDTLADLQTGLLEALRRVGMKLVRENP